MSELTQPYQPINQFGLIFFLFLVAVAPAIVWVQSVGDVSIYFKYETPPGQVYYLFSKLAGMYAVLLLWLQVVMALIVKMPIGERLPFWSRIFHRNLGLASLAFLLLHAGLFVAAVSIRKAHFAYGLLLPNFDHGFYAFAVTLGVLALYGVILVVIAGYLRKRGINKAKWFHRISIVALALTLIHCLLIGTETRYFAMIAVYAIMISIFIAAIYYRVLWYRSGQSC